jgi:hypothetical protein
VGHRKAGQFKVREIGHLFDSGFPCLRTLYTAWNYEKNTTFRETGLMRHHVKGKTRLFDKRITGRRILCRITDNSRTKHS